jgi:hypothetical protein
MPRIGEEDLHEDVGGVADEGTISIDADLPSAGLKRDAITTS